MQKSRDAKKLLNVQTEPGHLLDYLLNAAENLDVGCRIENNMNSLGSNNDACYITYDLNSLDPVDNSFFPFHPHCELNAY